MIIFWLVCLVQNIRIHLISFIRSFTFSSPFVIELAILKVYGAKFYCFCSKSWTGLHFVYRLWTSILLLINYRGCISLLQTILQCWIQLWGFRVVEYSSPIKRKNDDLRSKSTKAQNWEQELILLLWIIWNNFYILF